MKKLKTKIRIYGPLFLTSLIVYTGYILLVKFIINTITEYIIETVTKNITPNYSGILIGIGVTLCFLTFILALRLTLKVHKQALKRLKKKATPKITESQNLKIIEYSLNEVPIPELTEINLKLNTEKEPTN